MPVTVCVSGVATATADGPPSCISLERSSFIVSDSAALSQSFLFFNSFQLFHGKSSLYPGDLELMPTEVK